MAQSHQRQAAALDREAVERWIYADVRAWEHDGTRLREWARKLLGSS